MKSFRRILLGVALAVVSSGVASAISIPQTFTLSNTDTDISGSVGTGTFNYFLTACPSCQASWLQNVTLSITVNENLNGLSVTNTAAQSQTFEYITYSNLTVVGTAPTADKNALSFDLFSNGASNFPSSGGCSPSAAAGEINLCDTGNVTYASGQTIVYAPPSITQSDSSGAQSASNRFAYAITGTFNLGFTTKTFQSFVGAGGNGNNTQDTNANATITVIYDYTIPTGAPEPTLFLMGTALVGVGLLRKRIKA